MKCLKHLFKIIVILCLIPVIASAQFELRGKIRSEQNTPLPYATVMILNASDSTFLAGRLSDEMGDFIFEDINEGSYLLQADMLSYETMIKKIDVAQHITIDDIILKESTTLIEEVQIVAQKPLYTKSIDRTTINIESNTTIIGGSVFDALSKSPGVALNANSGDLSLLGRKGVVVMINNKRVNMEGVDLLNYLRSLPTSNIKNIELIHNPPASYGADGNGGVINITTKKKIINGTKQILGFNIGHGDGGEKAGLSHHLEYVKNRFSLYTNLSATHDDSYNRFNYSNSFPFGDQQLESELQEEGNYNDQFLTVETGISYKISDQTSLTADISQTFNGFDDVAVGTSKTKTLSGFTDSYVSENLSTYSLNTTVINTGVAHKFSPNLSANINYNYVKFKNGVATDYSFLLRTDTTPETSESNAYATDNSTLLDIHIGDINFNQIIGEKLSLEYGSKLTKSSFDNTTQLEWSLGTPAFDIDDYQDNSVMDEQIWAVYLSGQYQVSDQVTFKTGVRYEDYTINLRSNTQGALLNKSQGRFYPTTYMSYTPSDNFSLNLSYGHRVSRPSFIMLAPAFYFGTPYRLSSGNPTLLPSTSHNYNFSLNYKLWNLGISYSQVTDPIYPSETTIDNENELIINRPIQAFADDVFNINLSRSFQIHKILSLNSNINLTRLNQNPIVNGVEVNFKYVQYTFLNTLNFDISESLKADLGVRYFSKSQYSTLKTEARWGFSAGFSKTFKNKISLTLNINDIFNNENEYFDTLEVEETRYFGTGYSKFEGQILRASLSIPLGKQDLETKASKKSLDEMGRLY